MNTSVKKNFNIYKLDLKSFIFLVILSLIPWIEFINTNFSEIDFIFTNYLFLIFAINLLILAIIYFSLRYFTYIHPYNLVCAIGFSKWLLFQHHSLKLLFSIILNQLNLIPHLSSEFALFFIILMIILSNSLIIRNNFFKIFFFIFLILNFLILSFKLTNNFYSLNKTEDNQKIFENNDISVVKSKKQNIYFFILDSMMPLDRFEDFYKEDVSNFKNFYTKKNFTYFKNIQNQYDSTLHSLTALFYLNDKLNFKEESLKKYPGYLRNQYNPKLLSELNKLGYEFKWIGNNFADCAKYNYKYCLRNEKKIYLDFYLIESFLKKTPFIQIYNKTIEFNIIRRNFDFYQRNNAIRRLENFLINNQDYVKNNNTFYFIHHLHPHWPYIFDEKCNYVNFPGDHNFEGYKKSYLCVTKQITNFINLIEKIDKDSLVIFQSDHNWSMSQLSAEKYGDMRSIFSLIKNNIICKNDFPENSNNVRVIKYLLNCLNS